jgi:hypothetical protein
MMRSKTSGSKSLLFLNKRRPSGRAGKKQKNFIHLEPALPTTQRHVEKFFFFFFSKKRRLLLPATCLLRDAKGTPA